jgi:hypothetical protein
MAEVRCPSCNAVRDDRPWTCPITGRGYTATVAHEPGCPVLREAPLRQDDVVAHLKSIPRPAPVAVEEYDEDRDPEDLGPAARWAPLDLRRRWANGEIGP